jgi:putative endonuclease
MSSIRIKTGKEGESKAVAFLKRRGYKIVETNFTCRFGELDIIAKDKKVLVFIEVKTRSNLNFGYPEEAINSRKKKNLLKLAEFYLQTKDLHEIDYYRFDAVSIWKEGSKEKIELFKDII